MKSSSQCVVWIVLIAVLAAPAVAMSEERPAGREQAQLEIRPIAALLSEVGIWAVELIASTPFAIAFASEGDEVETTSPQVEPGDGSTKSIATIDPNG